MTLATVPAKVSGDVFTVGMWTTYIRNNINELITPPKVRCWRDGQLPSVPSATWTPMEFTDEAYDTGNMWAVGFPSRFVIPENGVYHIFGQVYFPNYSSATLRALSWRANGTGFLGALTYGALSASGECVINSSFEYELSAGDYLEMIVSQYTGSAQNVGVATDSVGYWVYAGLSFRGAL